MSEEIKETRAVRVAKRRAELLKSFNDLFVQFLEVENRKQISAGDKLLNAVRKIDAHVQSLIIQKPQESSFYISIALEFQRNIMKRMDEIAKDKLWRS